MNIDRECFLEALEDDLKARQAVGEIYSSCISDYAHVPGVEESVCEYVQEISDDLYAQLDMVLSDLGGWKQLLQRRMQEAQEKEHAAALALLACLLYRPDGSRIQEKLQTREFWPDVMTVISCFVLTPMEGAFACRQREYPCLRDDQVRRLGRMLSAVFYGKWTRLCGEQTRVHADPEKTGAMAECADPGTMAVWGFAAAELMCSGESSLKGKRYVHAVSMVALANLSMTLQFDSMSLLQGCLVVMFSERRMLLDTLKELCHALGLRAQKEGHIVVNYADEDAYHEQDWLDAFRSRYAGMCSRTEQHDVQAQSDSELSREKPGVERD